MRLVPPADIFGRGLLDARRRRRGSYRAFGDDGSVRRLPLRRWVSDPEPEEERLLAELTGPVLDVGCGAGRHLEAMRRIGVAAIGVDISPQAVALARHEGNVVLEGSIFSELPAAGHWATALLLDGNVGIGGDPAALLRRVAGVLSPEGSVLVELDPPGEHSREVSLRIEGGGKVSECFPWAWVSVDDVAGLASRAGLAVGRVWSDGGRWFARLDRVAVRPRRGSPGLRLLAGGLERELESAGVDGGERRPTPS